MKTPIILLIVTLVISPCSAVEKQNSLFDNPLALFQKSFVSALSHSETAKIQTTWRGFYLRADNQTAFKNGKFPSASGIYLDVEVRDTNEIPSFVDSIDTQSGISTRIIKLPAPKTTDSQGMIITLIYGSEANREAVKSIERSIADIERMLEWKK